MKRLSIALLVLATPMGAAAHAAALDAVACAQLTQELLALDKAGARAAFLRGPAAAKSMKADELAAVQKLIETEAQFLFRCPQPKRTFDPATEAVLEHGTGSDPDPDAAKPAEGSTTPGTPAPKAAAKKQAKPKAPPAAATDPAAAGEAPAPAAAPPKAKRAAAAKPKAADAFVPPAAASAPQPQ